jgi:hypothetical protein
MHYITNHVADLDGATAHAETYFFTVLELKGDPKQFRLGGGRYLDRLERRDGEWRIAARVVVAQWSTTGEPHTSDGVPIYASRRDHGDLSYARRSRLVKNRARSRRRAGAARPGR